MKYPQIKLGFLLIAMAISNISLSQNFIEPSTDLKISTSDSVNLINTWNSFLKAIKEKNGKEIEDISLNMVYNNYEGTPLSDLPAKKLLPITIYKDSVLEKFDGKDFMTVLSDSSFRLYKIRYPNRKPKNLKLQKGEKLTLYSINFEHVVTKLNNRKFVNYYTFHFVKQNNKFIFFGTDLVSPI
jgi:hypothetical protein